MSSIKVFTLSLALTVPLLLSGCSGSSPTPDIGTPSPAVTSSSTASPDATQADTEPDTLAVTSVFKEFMTGAFTINDDERTELLAAFQVDREWTDEDKENILLVMEEIMPELSLVDSSNITADEKAEAYFSAISYANGTDSGIELNVPSDAVTVNGDQASIDLSKVTAIIEGEDVAIDYVLEISSSTVDLVKVDGNWLLNAKSLIAEV
jgi:hypothetical protein